MELTHDEIRRASTTKLRKLLKEDIDEYDENLYEILASYVLDEPDSYYNMLDFINDRKEQF